MTLVLSFSYSEYSTEKPHSCSRFPTMCAQSRSRPGGLTVSKRRRSRARATASWALMRGMIPGSRFVTLVTVVDGRRGICQYGLNFAPGGRNACQTVVDRDDRCRAFDG